VIAERAWFRLGFQPLQYLKRHMCVCMISAVTGQHMMALPFSLPPSNNRAALTG
jgi:hypothetical protein